MARQITTLWVMLLRWKNVYWRKACTRPYNERAIMILEYAVGLSIGDKYKSVKVEAEDALIAALKVKHENPSAKITYVRKRNKRGDLRHLHIASGKEAG